MTHSERIELLSSLSVLLKALDLLRSKSEVLSKSMAG
jgi:hypothetical protein